MGKYKKLHGRKELMGGKKIISKGNVRSATEKAKCGRPV